jgi:hypothetical protein
LALLDQARAGLLATVVARESRPADVTLLRFDRVMQGNSERIARQSVRIETGSSAAGSFTAAQTATGFVQDGFVRDSAGMHRFQAPDADVLLADGFSAGYCFRIARAEPGHRHELGLAFTPANPRRGRVDIAGTLWVDTLARALRTIQFRYVGFDNDVVEGFSPGGKISFAEIPNGVVLIDRWSLRLVGAADTTREDGKSKPVTRRGFLVREVGGELARAVWPGGESWVAPLGHVRFTAVNRDGLPARSTLVRLDSTDYVVRTDSMGVGEIHDVVPGPYDAVVADPRLAALKVMLTTPLSFDVTRDSVVALRLVVPTADELIAQACRGEATPRPAWLLGRALTAGGQPVSGAKWTLDKLMNGAWLTVASGGITGASGLFYFCKNIFPGETVRIHVWLEGEPPRALVRRMAEQLTVVPVLMDERLADGGSAMGPRRLQGTLSDSATGTPVAGALVGLVGTRLGAVTDSSGRFAIANVLPGEYMAEVRTWSLDSLGAVSQTPLVFKDSNVHLQVRVPTASQIVSGLCDVRTRGELRGVIVGSVAMRGELSPRPNAKVFADWIDRSARNVAATAPNRWMEARTDARGEFRLCGVPVNTSVVLRAEVDSAGAAPLDVRIPEDARFTRAELTLDKGVPRPSDRPRAKVRELVGVVRDTAGVPIEGATVEIRDAFDRTDKLGTFRLWTPDTDTISISVRRLGYAALSAQLKARDHQWDTVVVQLGHGAQVLAAVNVDARSTRLAMGLREFEERRAKGAGVFVTRDEILARNTIRPSEVLRDKRGVRLAKLRLGGFGVRFARYADQACTPVVWMDGVQVSGMEVDEIAATDIEGIELYENWATLPFQFTPRGSATPCGTVVIWSRVPAGRGK